MVVEGFKEEEEEEEAEEEEEEEAGKQDLCLETVVQG